MISLHTTVHFQFAQTKQRHITNYQHLNSRHAVHIVLRPCSPQEIS